MDITTLKTARHGRPYGRWDETRAAGRSRVVGHFHSVGVDARDECVTDPRYRSSHDRISRTTSSIGKAWLLSKIACRVCSGAVPKRAKTVSKRVLSAVRMTPASAPALMQMTLANGTRIRRTSSGPGQALLTGVVDRLCRRAARPGRLEQAGHDGAAWDQQDSAVLPQQQRGRLGAGRRSLRGILQACAGKCRTWCRPA